MAKSQSVARYNPGYFPLTSSILREGKSVTLTLPHAQAAWLRHDYYAFRRALEHEGHDLARPAQAVVVTLMRMPDGQSQVTFGTPSSSPTGSALATAMKEAGIDPHSPHSPHEGHTLPEDPDPLPDEFEESNILRSLGYHPDNDR